MPKAVGRQLRWDDMAGHAECGLIGNLNRVGGGAKLCDHAAGFQQCMYRRCAPAPWPAPLLRCANDYTACEFDTSASLLSGAPGVLPQPQMRRKGLSGADHTGFGAGDQVGGLVATLNIWRRLQAGNAVAQALPALLLIKERT